MVVERASETRQRGQLPHSAPGGIGWPQRRQVFAPVVIEGDGWFGSKYYRLEKAEMLRPRPGIHGGRWPADPARSKSRAAPPASAQRREEVAQFLFDFLGSLDDLGDFGPHGLAVSLAQTVHRHAQGALAHLQARGEAVVLDFVLLAR